MGGKYSARDRKKKWLTERCSDESGISQIPTVVRTWAETGKTPVVRHPFNWKKLSLLLFATPFGLVLRDLIAGAFCSERILLNLRVLLDVFKGRRVLVVWDGAPIHRSRLIAEWLELPEVKPWIEVVRLPAYAPEFNPVELLFSTIKRKGLGNFPGGEDLGKLCTRVHTAIDAIAPENVANCFKHALGSRFDSCQVAA